MHDGGARRSTGPKRRNADGLVPRLLLYEKAHNFQIVVFTCRPQDYLAANAMVPKGKAAQKDTDGGFVRAIDLGRGLLRR